MGQRALFLLDPSPFRSSISPANWYLVEDGRQSRSAMPALSWPLECSGERCSPDLTGFSTSSQNLLPAHL